MLFSVERAFVGRDETRAPLKTPAWEASGRQVLSKTLPLHPSWNSILMAIHVTTQIWVILLIGPAVRKFPSTNQKHYAELGSDTSSVWNFCACFSAFISWGNQWWHHKMPAVFLGYCATRFLMFLPHPVHIQYWLWFFLYFNNSGPVMVAI